MHRFIRLLLPLLLLTGSVNASDLAREQRIVEQIIDYIMDGDPVFLDAGGLDFLAIHTESAEEPAKGSVLILHGRALHPNTDNVIHPLRTGLTEHGWHTLALQMPVLGSEAKYYDYEAIFAEAAPRIEAGLAYLREQSDGPIVIIAHSCGAHMAMDWIRHLDSEPFAAFIGIGMGATDYQQPMHQPFPFERISVPVLDLYGSDDYPAVLRMATERRSAIEQAGNPHSQQQVIDGSDHYHRGHGAALVDAVSDWLDTMQLQ